LMVSGLPVAFCFFLVCMIGILVYWGGASGMELLVTSIESSIATFSMLPLPLFVLMGDVMFHSGIAPQMISALDKWMGRLPGRLSLLAVGAGTLLGALTGVSMASVSILGTTLVPEMKKKGYDAAMSVGPILGSAGLAILIPPSPLAVLIASIAEISVGGLLVAAIMPGLLLAVLFAVYIILRCVFQPAVAPVYEVQHVPFSEKLVDTVRYILPVGIIIFFVIGVMLLGIATPTESAATGALSCFILAALYKKFNWQLVKKSLSDTVNTTGMMLLIIAASTAFSQILVFSGVSTGLSRFVLDLPIAPILIIVAMQLVGVILGMFMTIIAIIMICTPIFIPVVIALGFDPMWFSAIFLVNIQLGPLSPPFGLDLYVMKGVVPGDITMGKIYTAAIPFCVLNLVAMALVIVFPKIALWLPQVMS
jgi:tripartite ATP-independent transporter DctM subunit